MALSFHAALLVLLARQTLLDFKLENLQEGAYWFSLNVRPSEIFRQLRIHSPIHVIRLELLHRVDENPKNQLVVTRASPTLPADRVKTIRVTIVICDVSFLSLLGQSQMEEHTCRRRT